MEENFHRSFVEIVFILCNLEYFLLYVPKPARMIRNEIDFCFFASRHFHDCLNLKDIMIHGGKVAVTQVRPFINISSSISNTVFVILQQLILIKFHLIGKNPNLSIESQTLTVKYTLYCIVLIIVT